MLYLNFMRWMAALFLLIGIFSIPNAYQNSLGERYTLLDLEAIEYAATHASIANLGGPDWTPDAGAGGGGGCSGNGFAAVVCEEGGWARPTPSAWDYACGRAPANVTSSPRSLSRYIFGGLDVACTKRVTRCACMPGWNGTRCETRDNSTSPLPVHGFCVPPTSWWTLTGASERAKAEKDALAARLPSVCGGRGSCAARVSDTSLTTLRYTFCQCDKGYYGDRCQHAEAPTDVHGDFFSYAFTSADAALCPAGALPRIGREFIAGIALPPAECTTHGFGLTMPTRPDGRLLTSNAYRVQTPSACFCEPGFAGEECIGGEAVPDRQGAFAAICSLLLLFGCTFLYRHRKSMEQVYDDAHVTPSDFTVFVNNLPTMRITEVDAIKAHFEQFGPVHAVSPATDDEKLVRLQKEKNLVLKRLQIMQEQDAWDRQAEAARRGRAFKEALPAKPNEDVAWSHASSWRAAKLNRRPEPVSVPPVDVLAGDAVDRARKVPFRWWARVVIRIPVLNSLVLTRRFLFDYLMYLNHRISCELNERHVVEFNRAFVTFSYSQDQDDCLDLYSDRREGIFGRRKPVGSAVKYKNTLTGEKRRVDMHFRGGKISVEQAPEPGEVLWDSLDVGPRMRAFRVFVVLLVMVAFIVGAFAIVIALNATKEGGIIGILIALGVLALNIIAAQLWIALAEVEQHYKQGALMRSVFWKTLITQICITLLAGTIAVYGYPFDDKNGYVQDWYKEAGGFVFRMVLIESVVPPLIDFLAVDHRLAVFLASFARSRTEWHIARTPPPFILAERCAALMRTVIMCCAFNAGLPVLNFAVAAGLFIRYNSDKWCMSNLFRLMRAGAELPRALELCLMFATAVNVVMNWATLRAGWATNEVSEVIFYIGIICAMWAILGYFSFKKFRGRDCWGGSGPLIPCVGWLVCFNRRLLRPFTAVHEAYMRLIFGEFFFNEYEDGLDETGGKTYGQLAKLFRLRQFPYYQLERSQLFPQWDSGEPVPPHMTGRQYKNSIDRALEDTPTELVLATNPLHAKERVRCVSGREGGLSFQGDR
jgi:RNA recognition motif-containing protein